MTGREDYFQDVVEGNTGIFGSEQAGLEPALDIHKRVTTAQTPAGVLARFACDQCACPHELTVEWPEVIAIKYGVPPHLAFANMGVIQEPTQWLWNKVAGGFQPEHRCRCSNTNAPSFTPQEMDHHLQVARVKGWLRNRKGPYEEGMSRHCATMAQSMAGSLQR